MSANPPSGRRIGIVVLLASFAGHLGNYLFYVIAARMVTPAEFATISALVAFATIALMPVNGIQVAVARDVALLQASRSPAELSAYIRRLGRRGVLLCAGALVVLSALSPVLAGPLHLGSPVPVILTAVWIDAVAVLTVATGMAQGMERFGYVAFSLAGPLGLLRAMLLPVCVLLAGMAGGIWTMILAALIGLAVLLPVVSRSARTTPTVPPRMPSTLNTMIALLAFASLTNVDMLVAQAVLAESERAQYASAVLLGKVALYVPAALALVLLPRATAAIQRGQSADRAVLKTMALTAAGGLAVSGLLWTMPASLLVVMFGPEFTGAKPLLAPLALVMTGAAVLWVHLTFATAKRSVRWTVVLVGSSVAHGILLAVLHGSPTQIITASAIAIGGTLVVIELASSGGGVRMLRRTGLTGQPAGGAPPAVPTAGITR